MKKRKIKCIIVFIISIIIIIVLLQITNRIEKAVNQEPQNVTENMDPKSKNEIDIENAKTDELLDYDEDQVWFNDDNYVLANFLPISGNVLKSEMLTKYLRENGYQNTESVTVIDDSLYHTKNKYMFSCKIDGTNDIITITWDSYKGLFSYFIKIN